MDGDRTIMESEKKIKHFAIDKSILVIGITAILITTLPYLLGFWTQKDQFVFSGFLFGVEDGNSYIAKMLLGSSGDWLFRSPYSAVDQNGLLAFFPYIVLGKLAAGAGLHEQLIVLFQLFRIAGVAFLLFVYARFFLLFFKDKKSIQIGLILVLFGAGWDWVILFFGVDRMPISFYSPETFGFLSIFGLPHLCFSRGFMLLGILELLGWNFSSSPRPFLKSGLFFLAAAIFQPLNLVIAYTVFGLWWLILLVRKKFILRLDLFLKQSLAVLIPLPFFVYYVWIVNADPFMKQWTAQNVLPSPPLIDYLLAFGPLILLLLLEIFVFKAVKGLWSDEKRILLLMWILVSFLLVYIPVNVQRRLMDGVWLASIILLVPIFNKIQLKFLRWMMVGSMMLTPVFLLVGAIGSVLNPSEPQFQPRGRVETYKELGQKAAEDAVVLAPFEVSNEIPAYAKLRVVTGHGPESINKQKIDIFLDKLYTGDVNHGEACVFLIKNDIAYVWFESSEYQKLDLQSIFKPDEAEFLIDTPQYKILKIYQCEP